MANQECSFSDIDFDLLDPIISHQDNVELIHDVTSAEIKLAPFDHLASDKTLGPDGFPPFFFQKYWNLIGASVCRTIKAYFHSAKMFNKINHTFITLIPKIDNPQTSNHFCPISLCSIIYKIISRMLTA